MIPRLESRGARAADYLIGTEKHRRLADAQLLLNLHRAEASSLEWMRFLECACNGCVMLTEPCADHHPLTPGEHFLEGSATSLPLLADHLLNEHDQLRGIRRQAYDFVREQLPMTPSVERLVAVAQDVVGAGVGPGQPSSNPDTVGVPSPAPVTAPAAHALNAEQRLGGAVRALSVQTRELRRELADAVYRLERGTAPDLQRYAWTPAVAETAPRVTVIVTLHDYEREVVQALASVAASQPRVPFDVLILDDASTDGSVEAVTGFLQAHPWLPATLLRQPVNRGLAHSRNALLERARGEYVFVLDADNGVYPSALARLAAALDADPEASFAYTMIAVFRGGSPFSLLSGLPWEPSLLRHGNYIDAMAMVRRRDILELGGYTTDPRLTGWEDFHLWCKCVEAGRRGVLVPQVLAWYRRTEHSMLTDVESSTVRAWSLMCARFPELLEPRTVEPADLLP